MESFQVDELKLYVRDEIKITDGVVLRTPTVGEIITYGEQKYFSMAQQICASPSSMKVALDDMNLDWMKVSDFELFIMLAKALPQEATHLLLGDLDLSQMGVYALHGGEEPILSNPEHTIVINEIVYQTMVAYLRKMHNFQKQVDKAGNRAAHKAMLMVARQDAKMAQNKPSKSFLKPIISAVKCRMGYTMDYIKQMGIFELMDDLSRLNVIIQADAALSGAYSGMVDTHKMDRKVFDWTRDITDEKQINDKQTIGEGKF